MSTLVLAAAVGLYSLSAAAYGVAFARPALARVARAAFVLAGAGFVVHAVAIGAGCKESGGQHLLTVVGGLGLVGWLAAGALIVVQRGSRTSAPGAFALPLVLAAVLPGLVAPAADADLVPPALASLPALQLHVTAAAGGIALFALACAFGLMYLLQHRQLKGKRFGPLLSRLPSLHALDRTNARLVGLGFAVFTVALVSGSVLARTEWCASWGWDGQQVASLVVWLMFGAIVFARRAGTRGRRQAVLTLVAFSLAMTWLVGVRQVRGGTKHGDFGTSAAAVACAADST